MKYSKKTMKYSKKTLKYSKKTMKYSKKTLKFSENSKVFLGEGKRDCTSRKYNHSEYLTEVCEIRFHT